ncbi:MAG: ATP-binding protein [Candidatus Omnitrophica bacterium]|nr:ATP-binding protein [Candidatus Omnitrophota bacterium]
MSNTYLAQIHGLGQEIDGLVKDILRLLDSCAAGEAVSFDIRLCLEEALINAVKHGNKNNKNLPIKVSYCISGGKFMASVEDSGNGFDYKKIPDPTTKENLLNTSGRGVYLIRRLMDEVSFNKSGSKITMVKYLK